MKDIATVTLNTERDRERHRDTETQSHRDTETETKRQKDIETAKERDRQRHRDKERQRDSPMCPVDFDTSFPHPCNPWLLSSTELCPELCRGCHTAFVDEVFALSVALS